VTKTPDWKQKYRDSVIELEAEERRWRGDEKVLRQLVNRLCAAGMGVDSRLDDELAAIAAANRRKADVAELGTMASNLSRAVTELDGFQPLPPAAGASAKPGLPDGENASPAPATEATAVPASVAPAPPQRWLVSRAAVADLLQRFSEDVPDEPRLKELQIGLTAADDDASFAAALVQAAEWIAARRDALSRERQQAAALLGQVKLRLEELVDLFAASADEQRSSFAAAETLNVAVLSEVTRLSDETRGATDLKLLQSLVSAGLESVGKCVREFRARADVSLQEQCVRGEHLRGRIAALEHETRDLHDKLDQERNRARVDSLTEVANRKAFDERWAQEIARRPHTDGPVTLLIFDIDNFKSINDTYGHRAGDRVLQSVARCLAAGVRCTDFVARIGGEEFALVLVGLTLEGAIRIGNELRHSVAALRFHFRGTPIQVTLSCGITELRERDSGESSFDRADTALYRAKGAGKNVCIAA
jgi:diguanylate cyclase